MEDLLEYERLVFSIISKYGNYFDREDLYQVGMIGLMDAYKHFDENVGVKFSSYAYYYILGEVTKFVRENRSVKVSKDMIKLNNSIERGRDIMRQRLGREPTDTEVSLFLEVDEEKMEVVKYCFNEYAYSPNTSMRKICADLTEKGYKSKRENYKNTNK